jgi:hypothetical protein
VNPEFAEGLAIGFGFGVIVGLVLLLFHVVKVS